MKIPKLIKISGHEIKIKIKKNLVLNEKHCFGLSYLVQNKIELAKYCVDEPVPESRQAETFLHEIIHYINTIHSIGLSEKKTDELALALFQTIRDNVLNFLDKK